MNQDDHLIRYLLGELDEDEIHELDQQALADDAFAKRLERAADDLIDAFVRDELENDRAERFAGRFLASETGRERVAFARTLAHHAGAAATAPRPTPVAPDRPRTGRPRLGRLWSGQRRLAWAALLTVGLGAGWWAMQEARPPGRFHPSLLLVQDVRGAATLPHRVLPADAETLTLIIDLADVRLDLSGGDVLLFGTIRDARGLTRWQAQDLRPEHQGGVQALAIAVPRQNLEPDRYALHLEQVDSKGAQRLVATYTFIIDPLPPRE
jgi:hypothetical protein